VNSYLVERYLPGVAEAEVRRGLERAQAACEELSAAGTGIRYLGSLFLPLEEACFCRFDSDDAETVAEVNARAQVPFARITLGVAVSPVHAVTSDEGARSQLPG
jgi:Protein of unknown function (DUF4242)